ncbi:MAG: metal-dependent hydrolase [Terriglobales bacterium]
MDTLTHSLVGVAISRVYFKKRLVYATGAAVIAANLPDLDVLYSWPGVRYLEFHRGILHSVWMIPVWAVLVALGLRWYAERHKKIAPSLWLGFLLGLFCVGSHVLLDWTTSYGIRLFAPFSQHWYALDWMPTLDPWVWLLLIVFLGMPMMLGLIMNEVGSRHVPHPHRLSAALALAFVAAWIGLRARQHSQALQLLNTPQTAYAFEGQLPYDWAAFPNNSNPFDWHAVVDLPNNYLIADVISPLDINQGLVRVERNYIKPPRTPAIQAAEITSTGGAFLWFARFPFAMDEQQGSDDLVTITDMRFAKGRERPTMKASIRLSDTGVVLHQGFNW